MRSQLVMTLDRFVTKFVLTCTSGFVRAVVAYVHARVCMCFYVVVSVRFCVCSCMKESTVCPWLVVRGSSCDSKNITLQLKFDAPSVVAVRTV